MVMGRVLYTTVRYTRPLEGGRTVDISRQLFTTKYNGQICVGKGKQIQRNILLSFGKVVNMLDTKASIMPKNGKK